MTDTQFAYKVLAPKRYPHHGGAGQWPRKGSWLKVSGHIVPCSHGLHLCRREDLIHWLGPEIWLAEYRGEPVVHKNKIVVAEARLVSRFDTWDGRTARLFAADCADRALRKVAKSPRVRSDPRSRAAVRAAREFAAGNISPAELAAARDAARDAARAAARAAEIKWQTHRLFEILDGKRYAT